MAAVTSLTWWRPLPSRGGPVSWPAGRRSPSGGRCFMGRAWPWCSWRLLGRLPGAARSGGCAIGAFLPGRFTAPLVSLGAVFAPQIGVLALQRHHAWGRVSPAGDATVPGTGTFVPFHPGLSIVQIMFLAGVTAVALGVLALPAAADGRQLCRAGAMIALAGLAAAAAGVALVGTARQQAQGVIIPALHTADSDRLVTYTPACDNSSPVPVCLHPAFRAMLPALAAALGPALRQGAGLPGAPVRVQLAPATPQQINGGSISISGTPPVLYLGPSYLLLTSPGTSFINGLGSQVTVTIIQTMIYGRPAAGRPAPGPAQHAIAAALLKAAGVPLLAPAAPGTRPPGNGVPGRRPARRPWPRPAGSPRCRRPPAVLGSPPTWPRCGPAGSPWRRFRDRRRHGRAPAAGRPGGPPGPAAPGQPQRPGLPARAGRVRGHAADHAALDTAEHRGGC